ncbi:hypothetical protein ABBQ32_004426 [Trebouxia sp. C0010 RCD-2024]
MPEASGFSKESLLNAESPTLAAYPSRKERGASKLKIFRKSAVKLADDLGRKSGYKAGLTGGRERVSGLTQQQMALYEPGSLDLQGMTEKGIDQLRADLAALDADCAEQIRKTVHDNYHQFIQACQGIARLEGEMQAMRALLGNSSTIVAALREIATPSSATRSTSHEAGSSCSAEWQESPEGQSWAEGLEDLDIAIAERRCSDAVQLLRQAEGKCTHPQSIDWSDPEHQTRYDRIEQQREQVSQRRAELGLVLESQVRDPNTKAGERRIAAGLMASAISKAWAHQQLLDAHTAQLRHQQEALSRPQNAGGGHGDGTEYASAISQVSFRGVALAANDVAAVFQRDAPELSSLFLVWALQETERCAQLLRQHALIPLAVPAGLGPTVHCCMLALLYCTALETSHSLMLSPRLMRDLWPTCEQVLQKKLRRLNDDLKREVATELDGVAAQSGVSQGAPSGWTGLVLLFPSAAHLVDTVKSTVATICPLAGSKAAQVLRKGVSDAFQTYTNALTAGFQKHQSPDGSFPYNLGMFDAAWVLAPFGSALPFIGALPGTVVQPDHFGDRLPEHAMSPSFLPADVLVEAVMELTSTTAEQQLPEATAALVPSCGSICDSAAFGNCLDALGTALGMQSA